MRQLLKFLHTLASCGLIGALAAYAVVLVTVGTDDLAAYASARQVIAALCAYVLIPSLAIALASGLLAIAVYRPFQELRWVWLKALLGISMFEATLGIVNAKANYAASVAAMISRGEAHVSELAGTLTSEWYSLAAILTLSVANVALGVWRPALKRRPPQSFSAP